MEAELTRDLALDGPMVAQYLEMEGKGLNRLCPLCHGAQKTAERTRDFNRMIEQARHEDEASWGKRKADLGEPPDGPMYTLSIGPRGFVCSSCGVNGSVLDLVRIARRCDEEDAIKFLVSQGLASITDVSIDGTVPLVQRVPPEHSEIYRAFLGNCRPTPDKAIVVLMQWGITRGQSRRFQLRYYARDYAALLNDLFGRFNLDALVDSHLLMEESDAGDGNSSALLDLTRRGNFRIYHQRNVPYLLIPYLLEGHVVYLKAQPLLSPTRLRSLAAPSYIVSGKRAPCPFNMEALQLHDRVIVTRSELDAMGVESLGYPAIALGSFSNPDSSWYEAFEGKELIFMITQRAQSDPRLQSVITSMTEHGLQAPRIIDMPGTSRLEEVLSEAYGPTPGAVV